MLVLLTAEIIIENCVVMCGLWIFFMDFSTIVSFNGTGVQKFFIWRIVFTQFLQWQSVKCVIFTSDAVT